MKQNLTGNAISLLVLILGYMLMKKLPGIVLMIKDKNVFGLISFWSYNAKLCLSRTAATNESRADTKLKYVIPSCSPFTCTMLALNI